MHYAGPTGGIINNQSTVICPYIIVHITNTPNSENSAREIRLNNNLNGKFWEIGIINFALV